MRILYFIATIHSTVPEYGGAFRHIRRKKRRKERKNLVSLFECEGEG
jgi:hypothetical protein